MRALSFNRLRARRHGFTLVELLVTITIIGILATIVAVRYSGIQEEARDSQREADVAKIMNALEKYYDDHGEYPSNDIMNSTNSSTMLPNFDGVRSELPGLTDEDLTGPGGYKFYPTCINTECTNSSYNWANYRVKSYLYLSRFESQTQEGGWAWFNVGADYGGNTGWGCHIQTYYDNPGYTIAWRRESDGIWVFKRSIHGQIEIAPFDTGPVAPQTCEFS